MMSLRTASIAEQDIVQTAQWLERQEAGLGERFLAAVEETITTIEQMPLACPTLVMQGAALKSAARWLGVRGFPHVVVFTVDQVDQYDILVMGVLHPHQDLESILRQRIGTQ